MSFLLSDGDVHKVSTATSDVLTALVGQIATVLVPALEHAAKNTLSGVVVTIGPITIEPIQIVVSAKEQT